MNRSSTPISLSCTHRQVVIKLRGSRKSHLATWTLQLPTSS